MFTCERRLFAIDTHDQGIGCYEMLVEAKQIGDTKVVDAHLIKIIIQLAR